MKKLVILAAILFATPVFALTGDLDTTHPDLDIPPVSVDAGQSVAGDLVLPDDDLDLELELAGAVVVDIATIQEYFAHTDEHSQTVIDALEAKSASLSGLTPGQRQAVEYLLAAKAYHEAKGETKTFQEIKDAWGSIQVGTETVNLSSIPDTVLTGLERQLIAEKNVKYLTAEGQQMQGNLFVALGEDVK